MKKEAVLYEKLDSDKVHCRLCAHSCVIADGKFGVCGVRKNEFGILYSQVYGETIASHVDPIEKKPLYHFLPGSKSFSIATVGCNFRCGFCQNWQISQAAKIDGGIEGYELMPEEIVREAKKSGCKSISYTYTEPTIFFEYAYDTAKIAEKEKISNIFVTNGFMTKDAVDMIKPYLDAANVDLKSYSEDFYKKICGGRLKPVLESIEHMKKYGIWVEITTLLVTGENDSPEELRGIARFIAGIDKFMPWHISRFHPDYKFTDYDDTPVESMKAAYNIAKEEGLAYVYLGNVPEGNDTYCPGCRALLVKRGYMNVERNNIKDGKCPKCGEAIEGRW